MAFNMFPFTNLHNLNTDWILKTIKDLKAATELAASTVAGYAARLLQAEQDIDALEGSRVSYAAAQQLTSSQQTTARGNIGAAPAVGVVYYDQDQALSETYKARARANIGAADAAVMPDVSDVVRTSAQTLTGDQKLQARENIGAAENTLPGAVKYSAAQSLTDAQKLQARENIGAAENTLSGVVKYSEAQSLTDAQELQARENIGAQEAGSYVKYVAQSLTPSEQARARQNIGAAEEFMVFIVGPDEPGTGYECTVSRNDILSAINNGKNPICIFTPIGSSSIYYGIVNANPTLGTVTVSVPIFSAATSLAPTEIYNIAIMDDSGSDRVFVNLNSYRLLPETTRLDSGKIPVVGSQGIPAWSYLVNVNTVSGTTPTIAPADKNVYNCGELASLSLSSPPASGAYSIVFTSGSTPTTITGASGILGLESFTPAARTIYEINVLDNRAVVGSWEVTS